MRARDFPWARSRLPDASGRIRQTTRAFDNATTLFSLDDAGNLIGLTPPGRTQEHAMPVTPINLTDYYSPPNAAGDATNRQIDYSYTVDRELEVAQLPNLDRVQLAYDDTKHRRVSAVHVAGAPASLIYAPGYHPDTRELTSVASYTPSSTLESTVTYSRDGALLTGITWSGAVAGSVGWTHTPDFTLATESVNALPAVRFHYDPDGQVERVGTDCTESAPTQCLVLDRSPEPDAPITRRVRTISLGQLTESIQYGTYGEPIDYSVVVAGSTEPLYQLTIDNTTGRDRLGRVVAKTEMVDGVARSSSYTYENSWLKTATTDGVTRTYAYDLNGNRAIVGQPAPTYNLRDELITNGGATYTYNASGLRTTKTLTGAPITQYGYDRLGNLTSVRVGNQPVTYVVDAVGRRIRRTRGTDVRSWLYRDALSPVAELNATGAVTSRFVYADASSRDSAEFWSYLATRLGSGAGGIQGGGAPAFMLRGTTVYRFITDPIGSVRLVVNAATGDVAQRLDYDEWGNVLTDTNPGFQPFGFAGGLYDAFTGLVHFGAREYDPEIGRWTGRDPIRFQGEQPNLYVYVANDPINWIDPEGQEAIGATLLGWGLAAGEGVAIGATAASAAAAAAVVGAGYAGYRLGEAIAPWIVDPLFDAWFARRGKGERGWTAKPD